VTAAVRTEWLKLRRSRPPWISLLAATIGTAVGGLFTYISLHPEQARDLGLLGDKAQLASLEPGWAGYFGLLAQIVAVGGSLIFGLTMLWTFGREFADRTAKDLLALPTGRGAIVTAKMATAAVWSLLLTGYIVVLGLGIGAGLRLTGWTARTAIDGLVRIAVTAVLTIALTSTFGLAASLGRGYLAGVAALFAALFSAQVIAALGYGGWYPYAVPALYAGITGRADGPHVAGYIAVAAVAVASLAGTIGWWQHADHHQ